MATTTQIRSWWSPPCVGPFTKVALYGKGIVSVRPDVVDATHALSSCLERYKYATRAGDTGAYNCRKITGGSGYSLHAYGVAIDLNWTTNPYGPRLVTDMPPALVKAIKAIRTTNGKQVWRWGGEYIGNKDAMHFEVVCHPADLATGIDPKSLPRPPAKPTVAPPPAQETNDMPIIILAIGNVRTPRLLDGPIFSTLDAQSQLNLVAEGVKQVYVTPADYDEINSQCAAARA